MNDRRAPSGQTPAPARPYRVVVPTRDSAPWINFFVTAYRRLGVQPIFLCDVRSSDKTHYLLEAHGVEIAEVFPKADRVEGVLAMLPEIVSSKWVVRFDDDELPSFALINWLDQTLTDIEEPSIALSRRDAMFFDGRLCYSRLEDYYFHPTDPSYLDPQWRVFRPREVKFTDAIHTPGFEVSQFATAPQRAFFVHFDWMVRSFTQRRSKIERYEAQALGGGWAFSHFYLPELHAPEDMRWTPFEDDEFTCLALHLLQIGGATGS